MMRALWTAASGMTAQQLNVDTISNNLSNVNTTGYKKERVEFKSLLYETMAKASVDQRGAGRPVNLQVGHGVRPIATVKNYTTGNMEGTHNPLDVAIDGDGFFVVQGPGEEPVYTRDGSFKVSMVDGQAMIVTSDGYPILNEEDEPIMIPEYVNIANLLIADDGELSFVNSEGKTEELDIRFKIVQFTNRQGLEASGQNFVRPTSASGEPISEEDPSITKRSRLIQGFLESSNVQVVEEMVKLIIAQRAYEVNSKAIQTSDDMLGQANQLKRG